MLQRKPQQATHYELLDVTPEATPEEINRAYRNLVLKWHLDKNKQADASDEFKRINAAHKCLMDPEERRQYNQNTPAVYRMASQSARPAQAFVYPDATMPAAVFEEKTKYIKEQFVELTQQFFASPHSHQALMERVQTIIDNIVQCYSERIEFIVSKSNIQSLEFEHRTKLRQEISEQCWGGNNVEGLLKQDLADRQHNYAAQHDMTRVGKDKRYWRAWLFTLLRKSKPFEPIHLLDIHVGWTSNGETDSRKKIEQLLYEYRL